MPAGRPRESIPEREELIKLGQDLWNGLQRRKKVNCVVDGVSGMLANISSFVRSGNA